MRDVAIVVPCYNEAAVVADVVSGLRRAFDKVVVVDDGSWDGSSEAAAGQGAAVVVHPTNLGCGAAIKTGIRYALLDPDVRYVCLFDADGQHRTADAVRLVDALRDSGTDVVLGSRFLAGSSSVPRGRRALLRLARRFEAWQSGIWLTDAHQGLRAFTRNFAADLGVIASDMGWASDFLRVMRQRRSTWVELPVTVDYTAYTRSKGQRSVNSLNIGFDVLANRLFPRGR